MTSGAVATALSNISNVKTKSFVVSVTNSSTNAYGYLRIQNTTGLLDYQVIGWFCRTGSISASNGFLIMPVNFSIDYIYLVYQKGGTISETINYTFTIAYIS